MRRRQSVSSESGQPHTATESFPESSQPSSALPDSITGGAAQPPFGESKPYGSSAQEEAQSETTRVSGKRNCSGAQAAALRDGP